LIPQSSDDKEWSPDDLDFVISAVNTLENRISFNRNQIVVAGRNSGGTMASLIAFAQRSMFKGLVLIDANLSQKIQTVTTSPVQPLLIYFGTENELDEKQQASIDRLGASKFPIHVEESTGRGGELQWAADLLKWTQTVDRL
jgi:poly(3-hydroxybutyrate) depolymerase